jgi:hypothetical protein
METEELSHARTRTQVRSKSIYFSRGLLSGVARMSSGNVEVVLKESNNTDRTPASTRSQGHEGGDQDEAGSDLRRWRDGSQCS